MTDRAPSAARDGALIDSAQRGERDAREALARRYRQRAYLFAYQLLGNPEDARDVAQEAMLRFFKSLRRFDTGRAVEPWLFRIVRNCAVDLVRRNRVRRAVSLDDPAGAAEPTARPDTRPDTQVQRRRLQERIWQCVQGLSAKQREILVLRDYQDLAYAEIASVLDIPKGTVMSRLHAARQALRAALGDVLGDDHE
ncbi:MAG: sigma-70 family RNA polymerase sigma factor [Planctomycetota bacterium]|nr:sigma-70 family RNA polymerase sigma factor [Planctomycetota bacterium]